MPEMNLALKVAILESRKKQKRIAKLAHMEEPRLSRIVRGHEAANPIERERLCKVLGRSEHELFPNAQSEAVAS